MDPGGNEGRSIRLALVRDIMPVLDEEATPPDWYGIYRATKEVYDQPYRALGHDKAEPYILYYWIPRISIAIREERNAAEMRRQHEIKQANEQATSRGTGSRGRTPRRVI